MHGFTRALPLVALLLARPGLAQDSRAYAGGSGFFSTQGSQTQGSAPDLPRSGVGGTTWGATGEIGLFVVPRLSVGVEFTLPARIVAIQETDYFQTFQTMSRYRDATVAFVAHAYTARRRGVRASVVGGATFVRESVFQSTAYAQGSFPAFSRDFGPFSTEEEFTRWTTGLTVGGDVEVAVSRHVSLVPQMRVAWVRRSQDPADRTWFLGLSSWVLRPAMGVRAVF